MFVGRPLLVIGFEDVGQMFVITWLGANAFLVDPFALEMGLGQCLDAGVLHGTDALFLKVFFNFAVVDAVDRHSAPQFLKLFVYGCVYLLVVEEEHFFLVDRTYDVQDVVLQRLLPI